MKKILITIVDTPFDTQYDIQIKFRRQIYWRYNNIGFAASQILESFCVDHTLGRTTGDKLLPGMDVISFSYAPWYFDRKRRK